jgi:hypothetical protein
MCKAAGKLIGKWSQNADTKRAIVALSSIIGIPIIELVVSRVGGNLPEAQRGIQVDPRVANKRALSAPRTVSRRLPEQMAAYSSNRIFRVRCGLLRKLRVTR